MALTQDMKRKFAIINALSSMEKPSLRDIHKKTRIPESTLKRQINAIRDEFGMTILYIREKTGEPGTFGYYLLADWGILDRDAFLRQHGSL